MKKDQVIWSSSFSLNIKEIDDQHKSIVNLVNDLYSHSSGNEDEEREYLQSVIKFAVDYIKNHFSTEEKYMRATKFPGLANHAHAHKEFIYEVVKTVKDIQSKKSKFILRSFANFLRDWVLSHIAVMDSQYGTYFRKLATRKSDGKLSITKEDLVNLK